MCKFSIKHKHKPDDTHLSEIKLWGFWGESKVGSLVCGFWGLGWIFFLILFVFNSESFLGQDTDKPDLQKLASIASTNIYVHRPG